MTNKAKAPLLIKKYATRRLYNTGTGTHITHLDVAQLVIDGVDFTVVDVKSGRDITGPVLTQVLFEREGKHGRLLPTTFLRHLIKFYGEDMQTVVPAYLELSMDLLTKFRDGASHGSRDQGSTREVTRTSR